MELNILLALDYYYYVDSLSKMSWFLFKKSISGGIEPELEGQIVMETISIWNTFYHLDIVKSEEYGLSKYYPLYGSQHEVIYKTFLGLLTYDNEPIKIGKVNKLDVEFDREMIEGDNSTGVNSYQILKFSPDEFV